MRKQPVSCWYRAWQCVAITIGVANIFAGNFVIGSTCINAALLPDLL